MKRTLCLLLSIIIIFIFASCGNVTSCGNEDKNQVSQTKTDSKDRLLSALASEETFIAEDGKSVYLKDFIYGSDGLTNYYAMPQKYVIIDLDKDGSDELVADITPNQVCYMVFHIHGDNIYGFLVGRRALQSLKEDGSFVQTGGANVNYYCSMKFDETSYRIIKIAVKDEVYGIYEIHGQSRPIDDVDKYIEEWHLKKDAQWQEVP